MIIKVRINKCINFHIYFIETNQLMKNFSFKYTNKFPSSGDKFKATRNQFIKNDLKQEIFKIAQNNLNMYKRLLDCNKSIYDKKKFIKDYRQSQSYKKNSCKYPCIDFYKTIRISKFFSSLKNMPNKQKLFINNNFIMKPKRKNQNKTPYQKLFFSNEINNDNKKNKLFLDKININIASQKKVNEHFKTHYILKDFFEKKENDKNDEKINNINTIKTNNFKQNKNYNVNVIRNSDNNIISKTNYKERTLTNKNINFNQNGNICLTEKKS